MCATRTYGGILGGRGGGQTSKVGSFQGWTEARPSPFTGPCLVLRALQLLHTQAHLNTFQMFIQKLRLHNYFVHLFIASKSKTCPRKFAAWCSLSLKSGCCPKYVFWSVPGHWNQFCAQIFSIALFSCQLKAWTTSDNFVTGQLLFFWSILEHWNLCWSF